MNFNDVETARQKYHQKTKKAWGITAAILLGLAAVILVPQLIQGFSFRSLASIFPLFFVFVISIIVIQFATRKEAEAYRKAYKAYFVEQNLKSIFTDVNYNHSVGLDPNILRATGMINTGDRYHSNDLTTARYRDVLFTQADAHIEEEHRDSDGDTTYVTIFRGRFMIFEFPKKFNFKLELVGRHFYAYRVPGKNPTTGRKMTKINTESDEFNKTFKILGEDGFEAYYLLDPAIMVKIQDIAAHYKNSLLLGFIDNKLLIALNDGKDSFEPPKASQPIDEQAETQKVNEGIKVITDFVDNLNLDRKLFK